MSDEALDLLRLHGGCADVFSIRRALSRIAGMEAQAVNELLTALLAAQGSGVALHYGPHRGEAA